LAINILAKGIAEFSDVLNHLLIMLAIPAFLAELLSANSSDILPIDFGGAIQRAIIT
jgi:hypothetical protein